MPQINLGIADVKVNLLTSTPYLAKNVKKYNFEISAYNQDIIINSPFAKPLLAEYIEDPSGTFAAFHPSKRKVYYNNAMDYGTATSTAGTILWTPMTIPPTGVPTDIKNDGMYDDYTIAPPSTTPADDYKGPIWEDNAINMPAIPNDDLSIKGYRDWYGSSGGGATTTTSSAEEFVEVNCVYQKKHNDGLWWAIESDDFLTEENTPFWVNFARMAAPSSQNHETCFIIRLGPGDPENEYDIYISLNQKPRIIDYLVSTTSGVPPQQMEFDEDLSRVVSSKKAHNDMEVGIMTIAGRLVVIVNDIPLVYARISREDGEDGGKLLECKIPTGKIQIFGTNVETRIIVCPMAFAKLSILALPLPTIIDESSGGGGATTVDYEGCDNHANPAFSVAHLPTPPSYATDLYGVDCRAFSGDGGTASPSGFGFHELGEIEFKRASSSAYEILPNTDFYTLAMEPDSTTSVAGKIVPYGGCPYFFRLKGLYEKTTDSPGEGVDVSEYLISADESATAPDYFHVKKSASLTFYNPDNIIGDLVVTEQTVIDISWSWSKIVGGGKTFTGIVVSMSKSEIAGKETITLNCEDYIYVLKNVPIINSPFYDGMVAVYAIQDLAERAGCLSPSKDWDAEDDYFLPAGYSFSQPKMRFNNSQMIMDCITEMVKRFEAYVYFDEDGIFHINKLAGGLFSAPTTPPVADFSSDPIAGPGLTILEERNVDISFESTINCISILTVDRDTRNAIIYAKTATGADDRLVFLKPFLYNQPAFGELDAARAWADDFALRAFNSILKTRFKTTGGIIVRPLEFVTVDGQMFRVMSVKRSFVAETNDMTCSYECEWLGG